MMYEMQTEHMKLTRPQILQLAGEAECDPRTVEKIYNGELSRKLVRERIVKAAQRLKLTPPVTL